MRDTANRKPLPIVNKYFRQALVTICLAGFCLAGFSQTGQEFAKRYSARTGTPRAAGVSPAEIRFLGATTNRAGEIIVTNLLVSAGNFRRVNGRLYDTQKSPGWQSFRTEIITKRNGVVIIQEVSHRSSIGSGGGGGLLDGPSRGGASWKEYGKSVAITNCANYAELAAGQPFYPYALRNGVFDYNGEVVELWDCGTVNQAITIRTNPPARRP